MEGSEVGYPGSERVAVVNVAQRRDWVHRSQFFYAIVLSSLLLGCSPKVESPNCNISTFEDGYGGIILNGELQGIQKGTLSIGAVELAKVTKERSDDGFRWTFTASNGLCDGMIVFSVLGPKHQEILTKATLTSGNQIIIKQPLDTKLVVGNLELKDFPQ